MRRWIATVAFLASTAAVNAHAHHVVSETGIEWVEPVSTAEVTTAASTFGFNDDFSGTWQTVAVRAEWSFTNSFSASANIPWGRVRFDDGRQAIGLMDVEFNTKLRLYASEHGGFIASAGLGAGLPTGTFEDGLGSGHFELAPFVVVSSQPRNWLVINGLVVSKHGLSTEEDVIDGPHGSLIDPHGDVETDLAISAAVLWGSLYIKSEARQLLSWQSADQHSTAAALEVGYAQPREFRFALRGDTWVSGWSRSGPKVSASFAYFF